MSHYQRNLDGQISISEGIKCDDESAPLIYPRTNTDEVIGVPVMNDSYVVGTDIDDFIGNSEEKQNADHTEGAQIGNTTTTTTTCWEKYKPLVIVSLFSFISFSAGSLVRPRLIVHIADFFGSDGKAAEITSFYTGVTALLGMFTAPMYGKLMDTVGRKPFFIMHGVAQLLSASILAIAPQRVYLFLTVSSLSSLFQMSFTTAYLADNFDSKDRMRVISYFSAVGVFSAVMSGVSMSFSFQTLTWMSAGLYIVTIVFALCFVQESLPNENRTPFSAKDMFTNPLKEVKFIWTDKVIRLLTVVSLVVSFAEIGVGDIYMYYLDDRIGFSATDNSVTMIEGGLLIGCVFLVILPLLQKVMKSTSLMWMALASVCAELMLVAFAWAVWPVFAIILPCTAFAEVMFPVVSFCLMNRVSHGDQGRLFAGLQALQDVASALAPFLFGTMYAQLPRDYKFMPFAIAALVALCAVPLIHWLRNNSSVDDLDETQPEERNRDQDEGVIDVV